LAGKTVRSRAITPQAARFLVASGIRAIPKMISATPLRYTSISFIGRKGGTIRRKNFGFTKCIIPANV
jgi:hypothetical protein